MSEENRRDRERRDRRAHPRGGRRDDDQKKPWYLRRRFWLAAASLAFVGWRRVRGLVRVGSHRANGTGVAA
jgi:hypothetical protein